MTAQQKRTNESDRRVIKTRKAIRDAFRSIVVKEGLHKINVSKIAKEANIHRKTFYLHFASIDELLNTETSALTLNATKYAMEHWDQIDEQQGIHLLVSAFNSYLNEDIEFFAKAAKDISSDYIVDSGIGPMRNIIEPLIEGETLLSESEWDTLLRFHLSGVVGVYRHALMQGETNIDSLAPTIEAILLASLESIKLHSAEEKQ